MILFSRKRARDEKGSARKGGLQLLESLLLVNLRGIGGAALQNPTAEDLEIIEAATLDPLVPYLWPTIEFNPRHSDIDHPSHS